MGQFSVEKPVAPGPVLSGNQHNQSVGDRARLFRRRDAERIHDRLQSMLVAEGLRLDRIYFCPRMYGGGRREKGVGAVS